MAKGTVKWFNDQKGFGFMPPKLGPYREIPYGGGILLELIDGSNIGPRNPSALLRQKSDNPYSRPRQSHH